ncbi:MAG: hypothetical protein ACLSVD_09410 [Eggerthellaceae bacterium]
MERVLFYPADFTFVCPTELKTRRCTQVPGGTARSRVVRYAFRAQGLATRPRTSKPAVSMLADPTHKLATFDVYIEEEGVANAAASSNPEGKIVCYEVNAGNIGRNAAELLRRVQASQFVAEHGDLCPARWVPGSGAIRASTCGQAVSLHRPRIIARAERSARSCGRAFSASVSYAENSLRISASSCLRVNASSASRNTLAVSALT